MLAKARQAKLIVYILRIYAKFKRLAFLIEEIILKQNLFSLFDII